MASPRRLLAFAGAACLSLAGLCQATEIPLSALRSQSNMRNVFYGRGTTFGKLSGGTVADLNDESAENAVFFRELTVWEGNPIYIILAGVTILLGQSALVALLMLQMRRRRHSEQTVRRLTRRLIHAGEEERRHLARELHDDIGQRLSLVSVELSSLNWRNAASRQDGSQEAEHALEELRTVISDVHGLSHRLHSSKLEHLGLKDALKELCQQIAQRHDVQLDLEMDELRADLDRDVTLCFYRVAQEALSNVVRHSSSSRAVVRLVVSGGMLRLQVVNDGAGFDTSKAQGGLGMVTMEERLRIVGGRLSVVSRPGEGTVVTAQVTLKLQAQQKSREVKRLAKTASRQKTLTDKQV